MIFPGCPVKKSLPGGNQTKTFYILYLFTEGGEFALAFTKQEKAEMIAQYSNWVKQSQAVFLMEYRKMTQKDVDALRAKVREAGGELHVVKNTLFRKVMTDMGIDAGELLESTTLAGFAFQDPPTLAKVINDAAKAETYKVKGGLMGVEILSPEQVKFLADLPPLPVMRAQLLGILQAPAAKLVRTIAEPGRSIAGVLKAYSEKGQAAAAA